MLHSLHEYSHFHPTNVPAQTHPRSRSKSKEEPLHIAVASAFSPGFLDPSFWSERLDIATEHSLISVDNPRICTHSRAGGNKAASDGGAGGRRYARQRHANGWVEAEGFVHDCLEVREVVGLREGDGKGEGAVLPGDVKFGC